MSGAPVHQPDVFTEAHTMTWSCTPFRQGGRSAKLDQVVAPLLEHLSTAPPRLASAYEHEPTQFGNNQNE